MILLRSPITVLLGQLALDRFGSSDFRLLFNPRCSSTLPCATADSGCHTYFQNLINSIKGVDFGLRRGTGPLRNLLQTEKGQEMLTSYVFRTPTHLQQAAQNRSDKASESPDTAT